LSLNVVGAFGAIIAAGLQTAAFEISVQSRTDTDHCDQASRSGWHRRAPRGRHADCRGRVLTCRAQDERQYAGGSGCRYSSAVHTASFDDSSRYAPQVVTYGVRGHAWDHVDPALPKFEKMPPARGAAFRPAVGMAVQSKRVKRRPPSSWTMTRSWSWSG